MTRGVKLAATCVVPTHENVVITGASAGVGRALARKFAHEGANVALLARGLTGLHAAAREVEEIRAAAGDSGVHALPISVDVADPTAVWAAADRIERELGPIDIWINNAMVTVFGRITDAAPEELRRVTDVTYHGAVWGTMAALVHMRGRGRGTIVQVGSALAHRAIPLQAPYCAAKHALRAFTEGLRVELLHDEIDVHLTIVQLPAVNTPQFTWSRTHMPRQAQPVPPIFQPEIMAETIHWAAHARRREVYVGWPTIKVVIGNKLAPGLVDRWLAKRGFDDQQTDAPVPADHRDNLFSPVDEDRGAQGIFSECAREQSRFARLVARAGSAGIRAPIAVITLAILALAGVGIYFLAKDP
jgi:short-subunit dehydrogenase